MTGRPNDRRLRSPRRGLDPRHPPTARPPLALVRDPVHSLSLGCPCPPARRPAGFPPTPLVRHPLAPRPHAARHSTAQHSTAKAERSSPLPTPPPPRSSPTTGALQLSRTAPGPTPHHSPPRAAPASLRAPPVTPHPVPPTLVPPTQLSHSRPAVGLRLPRDPQAHSPSVPSRPSHVILPHRCARVPGKALGKGPRPSRASAETRPEWPAAVSAGSQHTHHSSPRTSPTDTHTLAAPGPPLFLGSFSPPWEATQGSQHLHPAPAPTAAGTPTTTRGC